MFRDSGQHLRANFVSIVKCEDEIRVIVIEISAMRPGLALQLHATLGNAAYTRRAFVDGHCVTQRC
jgi:hypothetical protein